MITMTDYLMLFREVIGFDCETRAKQLSSLCRQSAVLHDVTASGSKWSKLISSRKVLKVYGGGGMDRPIELQLRCHTTAAVWWQMLPDAEVKEIVTIYCEVHAKHLNTRSLQCF